MSKNCCNDIKAKTSEQMDIKSKDLISAKIMEFQELVLTKSPESEKICIEVKGLESNLRKKYGFSNDENLTKFPKFKFVDPEIDNQLD